MTYVFAYTHALVHTTTDANRVPSVHKIAEYSDASSIGMVSLNAISSEAVHSKCQLTFAGCGKSQKTVDV